jgi:TATA-box binding protein (TBP) (component of TFIID and TFIIIB)
MTTTTTTTPLTYGEYDDRWFSQLRVANYHTHVLRGSNIRADQIVATPIPQNMVASVKLSAPLSFPTLICKMMPASCENQKFPQLKIHVDFGIWRACILAYEKGKVVINATTSLPEILCALQFFRHELEIICADTAVENFEVVNIVYNAEMPCCLNLKLLRARRGVDTEYKTKLFPGLIMKTDDEGGGRMLLFGSGRVLLTGVRNGDTEAVQKFKRYYNMLTRHGMTREEYDEQRRVEAARKAEEKRRADREAQALAPKTKKGAARKAARAAAAAAAAAGDDTAASGQVHVPAVPKGRRKAANAQPRGTRYTGNKSGARKKPRKLGNVPVVFEDSTDAPTQ